MGPEQKLAESHISMNKLNHNNWNVWKFQIKVILMAKDLYNIVTGINKQPAEGAELMTKWKLRDAKAQEALVTRMEEEPLAHIMQCSSAHEMWTKLGSIYDRQSVVSKHLLNEQFYNAKFDGDVNSFITKITNICVKIKQWGDQIPERMVITKILMSLPERFKHFRAAWESVPCEKQDINHLTSRLLIEEEQIGKQEEETVALVSTKFEKKCYSCGKKGHMKNQCKKNMECFYCKKNGHLMKDCFHKKQKERGENKQQKEQSGISSNFSDDVPR